MPRCSHCKKWIVGGMREGDLRFCSDQCHEDGFLCKLVEDVDNDLLSRLVDQLHGQPCPLCNNDGPSDVYVSHTATAFIIHFRWKDLPNVCCRRCGVRHIWRGIIWTSIFGWWHFPGGIVAAPWQILNGIKQLASLPNISSPSARLTKMVKLDLAKRVITLDS